MTDTDLQSTIDKLREGLKFNEQELTRIKGAIAYCKSQIKEFEKEQQRRKKWAETNSLPSAG